MGSDPQEAASVRAGWMLVDAHERLGSRQARETFRPWLEAWFDHARATLADLRPWQEGLTTFKINLTDTNRLRHRRTLDMILDGDTVFDVGSGKGYLCGLLLRDRAVAAYHGIDIVPWHLKQMSKLLTANQLPDDNVSVRIGDLYELRRESVEASGATVVTCSEVLEHLPDAGKALRVLAQVLPYKADLVFSVPLYGRLESVWGHRTTFDATRLKHICEDAGLYVHHVEPVANTWTLIVASRRPEASARIRHAAATGFTASPSLPLTDVYDFVPVNQADIAPRQRALTPTCKVSPAKKGDVRCEVARYPAAIWPSARLVGITFPVRGLTALRIRLRLPDQASVSEVVVAAYAGSRRVGQWHWRPRSSQLSEGKAYRWAFRPGEETSPFAYRGRSPDVRDVDRVEVLVRPKYRKPLSIVVGAAYIPGPSIAPAS